MSSKVFRGAAKKQDAEKALQKRSVLVLFFMNGCPHCEANKPAWEDAKKKADVETVEIDEEATPESAGVNGFPTMMYNGKTISGQKSSGDEILEELKVPKKSKKSGGRRATRGRSHRRNRKLRHRTLRNNVALI